MKNNIEHKQSIPFHDCSTSCIRSPEVFLTSLPGRHSGQVERLQCLVFAEQLPFQSELFSQGSQAVQLVWTVVLNAGSLTGL